MIHSFANTDNIVNSIDNDKGFSSSSCRFRKKLEYLCKETHPLFCQSFFKKTSSTNLQSAKIFYEFLITEYNNNNVRINTTLTYIMIISLFNEFVHYKEP